MTRKRDTIKRGSTTTKSVHKKKLSNSDDISFLNVNEALLMPDTFNFGEDGFVAIGDDFSVGELEKCDLEYVGGSKKKRKGFNGNVKMDFILEDGKKIVKKIKGRNENLIELENENRNVIIYEKRIENQIVKETQKVNENQNEKEFITENEDKNEIIIESAIIHENENQKVKEFITENEDKNKIITESEIIHENKNQKVKEFISKNENQNEIITESESIDENENKKEKEKEFLSENDVENSYQIKKNDIRCLNIENNPIEKSNMDTETIDLQMIDNIKNDQQVKNISEIDYESVYRLFLSSTPNIKLLESFYDLKVSFPFFISHLPVIPQNLVSKLLSLSTSILISNTKSEKLSEPNLINDLIELTRVKDRNTRYLSTYVLLHRIKSGLVCDKVNPKGKKSNKNKGTLDIIINLFDSVFILRCRDVDPNIRSICVDYLAHYVTIYPVYFCDFFRLKYLGWSLDDRIDSVKRTSIKSFIRIVDFLKKQLITVNNKKISNKSSNFCGDSIIKLLEYVITIVPKFINLCLSSNSSSIRNLSASVIITLFLKGPEMMKNKSKLQIKKTANKSVTEIKNKNKSKIDKQSKGIFLINEQNKNEKTINNTTADKDIVENNMKDKTVVFSNKQNKNEKSNNNITVNKNIIENNMKDKEIVVINDLNINSNKNYLNEKIVKKNSETNNKDIILIADRNQNLSSDLAVEKILDNNVENEIVSKKEILKILSVMSDKDLNNLFMSICNEKGLIGAIEEIYFCDEISLERINLKEEEILRIVESISSCINVNESSVEECMNKKISKNDLDFENIYIADENNQTDENKQSDKINIENTNACIGNKLTLSKNIIDANHSVNNFEKILNEETNEKNALYSHNIKNEQNIFNKEIVEKNIIDHHRTDNYKSISNEKNIEKKGIFEDHGVINYKSTNKKKINEKFDIIEDKLHDCRNVSNLKEISNNNNSITNNINLKKDIINVNNSFNSIDKITNIIDVTSLTIEDIFKAIMLLTKKNHNIIKIMIKLLKTYKENEKIVEYIFQTFIKIDTDLFTSKDEEILDVITKLRIKPINTFKFMKKVENIYESKVAFLIEEFKIKISSYLDYKLGKQLIIECIRNFDISESILQNFPLESRIISIFWKMKNNDYNEIEKIKEEFFEINESLDKNKSEFEVSVDYLLYCYESLKNNNVIDIEYEYIYNPNSAIKFIFKMIKKAIISFLNNINFKNEYEKGECNRKDKDLHKFDIKNNDEKEEFNRNNKDSKNNDEKESFNRNNKDFKNNDEKESFNRNHKDSKNNDKKERFNRNHKDSKNNDEKEEFNRNHKDFKNNEKNSKNEHKKEEFYIKNNDIEESNNEESSFKNEIKKESEYNNDTIKSNSINGNSKSFDFKKMMEKRKNKINRKKKLENEITIKSDSYQDSVYLEKTAFVYSRITHIIPDFMHLIFYNEKQIIIESISKTKKYIEEIIEGFFIYLTKTEKNYKEQKIKEIAIIVSQKILNTMKKEISSKIKNNNAKENSSIIDINENNKIQEMSSIIDINEENNFKEISPFSILVFNWLRRLSKKTYLYDSCFINFVKIIDNKQAGILEDKIKINCKYKNMLAKKSGGFKKIIKKEKEDEIIRF